MKRTLVILTLLAIASSSVFAVKFVKVNSYQIGPGTHYSYYEEYSKPWTIHVTKIDLKDPNIFLETVTPGDVIMGRERTSSMSARSNRAGHRVVSAINGDFCDVSNGNSNSPQVSKGEFVKAYSYWHSAFAYSKDGIACLTYPQYSGLVVSSDGSSSYPLSRVNETRETNNLLIYNSYNGSSTGTNASGFERLAHPVTDWVVNDTVFCVIESDSSFAGNMTIPAGKIVLSGHDAAKTFLLDECQIGDTVKIVQQLNGTIPNLTELVGGGPKMLENGTDVSVNACALEGWPITFATYWHPRTAIGYNDDSTIVYFVVVDGRQSCSRGINLIELGSFMKDLGVQNAINLDGGGSSTMIVRNSVMNNPSDGEERAVSNSMLCISSAPNGVFTHLQIGRDSIAVYKNKSVYLGLSGWDEHYNPTGSLDWNQLSINYDNTLGTFESNVFTAAEKNGTTSLNAEYNGETDSILVHIIELIDLSIYPDTLTLDSVNSVKYAVTATTESGGSRVFDNSLFKFTVLDPSIAEINDEGVIIGKDNGETDVIFSYGDEYDTAHVIIEIGSGEVVVDELETMTGWTLSSDSYIDAAQTSITLVDRIAGSGTKALKVNYARTGDEDGHIYFETVPIDIYGVPSDILVDVLSDSIKHWIYVLLEDARGVEYSVKCPSSLRYNDDYRTQYLDLAKLLPADKEQLYPLKVTGIRLRIDDKATTGSLYVDRIRVIYPTWTSIEDEMVPSEYCLHQNYPNPFNPLTKISYEIAEAGQVNLSVYDITGNRVATLVHGYQNVGSYNVEFMADKLSTGIYFYRLRAGNWIDTKKMLLIK